MTEDRAASGPSPLRAGRADWVLLGIRWLLALGLLLLDRLRILPLENPSMYLLLGYLLLTLLEALALWQNWTRNVWAPLTLALDITWTLVLLFLNGGAASPLMTILLVPVAATGLRLGFTAGLGLNLAALAGYVVLVMQNYFTQPSAVDLPRAGVFAATIVMIGAFGGLLSDQLLEPAREGARRYEDQIKRLQSQCAEANTRARVLYDMSRTLSVTMSYQKVLESILEECRRLIDFSVGVVLLSAGQEELFVAVSSGLRISGAQKQIHLTGGALSECLSRAEPMLLEYLGRDGELAQVTALQRCCSGLIVPLRAGLRNYGAIILGSINEGVYTQAHLTQLAGLAHFATIAIQNAQLYQDLREERDKIIRAEENVRKELSRDLHDGPAQSLAAIAMNIEFIKRLLADEPARAVDELTALEQLARKTSWDIRTMLFELRPIILETQGLVPTLEQYVQRFPASEGLQVHLDTGGFDQRLDPKVETTVFTIMQEAVNNARKHAKAKNIWMRLTQKDRKLVAMVQDDGVGFDLEAVQASYERRGSFGLLNMQERAQLIGGRTEIRSTPGKGTAVIITVPLERE